ncbi:putative CPSF6/7 family protein [Helianthus annuus]|nr:putative CPSF6/7 family protein [Helianthus annuus]
MDGDPNDHFHRNEAISAVVDEGFLGEDDDDDYEDLYNDVNVGEGFHQSIRKDEDLGFKNQDQVENKLEPVEQPVPVDDGGERKYESNDGGGGSSRVEVDSNVRVGVNEAVGRASGGAVGSNSNIRVELGQASIKAGEVERGPLNNENGMSNVGMGGRGMMGNGFGPLPMMHPQSMMGQGFEPSFGGPMGRMGSYGGFPGGPTPPFAGMLPSFPPVPGLAPHVNPAFFGRGMPMNGMGMMPTSGADGSNMGMWPDPNTAGWAGDEQGGRVGESSYGEEAASDQQYGEGTSDRRHRDDRDHEHGYERDLPREKEAVHEDEWSERKHRDERDQARSRDRDKDRDRERSRDRGRDRHRDERDRYADHHRYREAEPDYDDEWDRGRSSRTHAKSRLAQEDEHRSRSRDADYGKRRRVTAE